MLPGSHFEYSRRPQILAKRSRDEIRLGFNLLAGGPFHLALVWARGDLLARPRLTYSRYRSALIRRCLSLPFTR